MKHEPKIYETVFIVNATLEDPQIEAVIEKTKDVILKHGGEIRAIERWGRRRLAYVIQKKNNGYYVLIEFKAPGELIAKLERHFQLEEQMMRHLVVLLDKKALKAKEAGAIVSHIEAPAEAAPTPTTTA